MSAIIHSAQRKGPQLGVGAIRAETLWSLRLVCAPSYFYLLYVEVLLVVVGHAPAHHLHRLEFLEHDRLTALLADAARHEIGIVALTE
jgi:hypothetical protein